MPDVTMPAVALAAGAIERLGRGPGVAAAHAQAANAEAPNAALSSLEELGRRHTRDVLNFVHELEDKGASLRVLEPAIDTGGPTGRS